MANYTTVHEKSPVFYPEYERKSEARGQTHYCPGCGHGIAHKLLAQAIDDLGIQDRTILVSPVGCSVFAYYYFDTGNIQAAHGRAPAVAGAVKRARPGSIVISYQGDGDLAAIGSAEILHAANRGENITVLFVNNAIYGMTGGQMAPTTLLGHKSTTTPFGRNAVNDGYPLHVAETLSVLDGPVYIERVALGNAKQILQAGRAVRRALENQVKGLGFSLVEILSPCPTIWKLDAHQAQQHVREGLSSVFKPGVYCDRTKEAVPRPEPKPAPALTGIPRILGIELNEGASAAPVAAASVDLRIRIAGFGGQGVLMLGQVLAEAGMDAGLDVSWLPSYGPEMRSGTSNCHVRISSRPVDSPLVTRPTVLLALNEPSLRKFISSVEPGGLVMYNGREVPGDCRRPDVDLLARPFTEIADELGESRAGNIVMLGALLRRIEGIPDSSVDSALARVVKTQRWLEIDRKAIVRGREVCHVS